MNQQKEYSPYSYFFILGLIYALTGPSIWSVLFFGHTRIVSALDFHAVFMIVGFILAFAVGFLMTAFPRFTGTKAALPEEIVVGLFLHLLPLVLLISGHSRYLYLSVFFIFLNLVSFVGRRYRVRKSNPPSVFIFLPFGLVMGLLGSLILFFHSLGQVSSINLYNFGKKLFELGPLLTIVFGVGGKLIPVMLGHEGMGSFKFKLERKKENKLLKWIENKTAQIQVFIFVSSFIFDFLMMPITAGCLRASCALWVAIDKFKILKKPKSKTFLTQYIWYSLYFLIIGLYISIIPSLEITGIHLTYIGGLSLLTIMVASRVSLSHGGFSLEFEKTTKRIALVGAFMIAVAVLRFLGPVLHYVSYTHLILAANIIWAVSIFIWLSVFLKKILKPITSKK